MEICRHLLQENNNQYCFSQGSNTVFMDAIQGSECLTCFPVHVLSLQTLSALLRQWDRDGVMTHVATEVMVCN